jgi:uncharacterized membrane protein
MPTRWMLARAVGLGASLGLLALILWPFAFHGLLLWPFALLAAAAGLCGIAILAMTAADWRFHRPRGTRIRAVRTFDLLLGLLLVLLAWLELRDAWSAIA